MFGKILKELRERNGYSMDKLIELYNKRFNGKMNKSTLSRYENNLQEPMYTVVVNMAKLFDVSVDYLSGLTSNEGIKDHTQTSSHLQHTPFDLKLSKYTDHHIKVIDAYIAKPEMQPAVDKLLGVKSEGNISSKHLPDIPKVAAQSGKKIKAGTPDLKALIKIEKSKKR